MSIPSSLRLKSVGIGTFDVFIPSGCRASQGLVPLPLWIRIYLILYHIIVFPGWFVVNHRKSKTFHPLAIGIKSYTLVIE
jgi:hypothetical protein